jgi:hypothetical protein
VISAISVRSSDDSKNEAVKTFMSVHSLRAAV